MSFKLNFFICFIHHYKCVLYYSGDPPICTLEQYYKCLEPLIGKSVICYCCVRITHLLRTGTGQLCVYSKHSRLSFYILTSTTLPNPHLTPLTHTHRSKTLNIYRFPKCNCMLGTVYLTWGSSRVNQGQTNCIFKKRLFITFFLFSKGNIYIFIASLHYNLTKSNCLSFLYELQLVPITHAQKARIIRKWLA